MLTRRRVLLWAMPFGIALGALVALAVIVLDPGAGGILAGVPTPAPPAVTPGVTEPHMTLEDKLEHEEELREQGRIIPARGPETAGTDITISGKTVQLPDDAYIRSYVAAATCASDRICPPRPWIIIRRGEQNVTVDGSGELWPGGPTEPFDPDIKLQPEFRFLRDALR